MSDFKIVINFTVECDHRTIRWIAHGLGASLCRVNNGEAPVTQSDGATLVAPFPEAIGATMFHQRRHCEDGAGMDFPLRNDSGYATHGSIVFKIGRLQPDKLIMDLRE